MKRLVLFSVLLVQFISAQELALVKKTKNLVTFQEQVIL